jgi:raffinose/stachyose/melibiose transport system substrate-binding protein
MKKNLKRVSLLLAVLFVAAIAAACSGGGGAVAETEGEGTASQQPAQTAESAAPASQAAAGDGGEVVLNYRTFRTDDEEVMGRLIEKFESENPGIKINYSAERDEVAYYQKLQADILAGQDLDVFDAHPRQDFSQMVKSGNILDVSDMGFNKDYDEGVAAVTSVDGKNYGFAPSVNMLGVIYNKALFEEMGVTPPTTFDELREVVAKSKEAGYGGIAYCGASVAGNWMAHLLIPQILGPQKLHDNYWMAIGNGEITDLNGLPGARKAFDTMAAINKEGLLYDNSDGIQLDQSIALFSQGQASMMIMGTWELANLDSTYAGMDIDIFPLPSLDGAKETYAEVGQIVCVYSKSPNAEAAKKWVEFLATPENAKIYCETARATPTLKGLEVDFEGAEILNNRLKEGGMVTLPLNDAPNFEVWGNIIQNMYSNVLFGSGDVDAELAEVDKLLKSAGFSAE